MKQTVFHHILCCCAALLCLAACQPENYLLPEGEQSDCISLNLTSAALPVSRATEPGTDAENKLNHVDVLIFNNDENKTLRHHERIVIPANNSGKVALKAKRSSFIEGTKYLVYIVANSSADVSVFAKENYDLNNLKALTQADEQIHMTGQQVQGTEVPETFLMDGIAYSGSQEPATEQPVVLNNGIKSENTILNVTLRRAAAKIIVEISHGDKVQEFIWPTSGPDVPLYYLRNLPYTTRTIAGNTTDADVDVRTTTQNSSNNFDWANDKITVTAYAYAHNWDNKSTLENELRLIVNIPMIYKEDDTSEPETKVASYYQIPVSKDQKLDRNTCYRLKLKINAPGGSSPSEPLKLEGITYDVYDWTNERIDVGGEEDRPQYLTLNEYDMEMRNITEDSTTLEFASSSAVTAEVIEVWYIDKFGQKKNLQKRDANDPDKWGEQYTTGGSRPQTEWKNECTIAVTPDPGLNGKLDVFSELPKNNTIRYIKIKVTNGEQIEREVVVAQYPLEYITNIQGWYSYRSDFGGTTFETKGDETTNNRYFKSKVAEEITSGNNKGKSNIYRYYWYSWSSTVSGRYENLYTGNAPGNARMYHVVISATSSIYTLGIPRLDAYGYTESSAANNVIISPSFMLASQLGALSNTVTFNQARDHCLQYVETYKDENNKVVHLEDWRLPTRAELEIIIKFQYSSDAMDEVIRRKGYWCADGEYVYNEQGQTGNGYIRCIRDAYDK